MSRKFRNISVSHSMLPLTASHMHNSQRTVNEQGGRSNGVLNERERGVDNKQGRNQKSITGEREVKKPMVVVVGTTAVGKSDFAMSLAKVLSPLLNQSSPPPQKPTLLDHEKNTTTTTTLTTTTAAMVDAEKENIVAIRNVELISADALQVYRHLPIITNQPSDEDIKRVRHSCVAIKDVWEEYSVGEFLRDVVGSVDGEHVDGDDDCTGIDSDSKRGKDERRGGIIDRLELEDTLGIVVGGTSYYVEHLLFMNGLVCTDTHLNASDGVLKEKGGEMVERRFELSGIPVLVVKSAREVLKHVQPDMGWKYITKWVAEHHLSQEVVEEWRRYQKQRQQNQNPPIDSITPNTTHVQPSPSRIETDDDGYSVQTVIKTNIVHELVQLIDPVMAQRWHPNDVRKLKRVVEVWYETGGERMSDVYKMQRMGTVADGDGDGGGGVDDGGGESEADRIRFPAVVVWVVDRWQDVKERIERRVDGMVERGLFRELEEFVDCMRCGRDGGVMGYEDGTRGISQAIGVKEFKRYIDLYRNHAPPHAIHPLHESSTVDETVQEEMRRAGQEGLEWMKIHTRQYAKRQITWLRNKLVRRLCGCLRGYVERGYLFRGVDERQGDGEVRFEKGGEKPKVLVYLVHAPGGRVSEDSVQSVANIVLDFIAMHDDRIESVVFPSSTALIPPMEDELLGYLCPNTNTTLGKQYICDICSNEKVKILNGEKEWRVHLASAQHRRRVRYLATSPHIHK
jgi:tRNA A37 N6-isopentenylltransferase MiaA